MPSRALRVRAHGLPSTAHFCASARAPCWLGHALGCRDPYTLVACHGQAEVLRGRRTYCALAPALQPRVREAVVRRRHRRAQRRRAHRAARRAAGPVALLPHAIGALHAPSQLRAATVQMLCRTSEGLLPYPSLVGTINIAPSPAARSCIARRASPHSSKVAQVRTHALCSQH